MPPEELSVSALAGLLQAICDDREGAAMICSPDGDVWAANAAARRALELSEADPWRAWFASAQGEDRAPVVEELIPSVLASEVPRTVPVFLETAQGDVDEARAAVSVTFRPLKGQGVQGVWALWEPQAARLCCSARRVREAFADHQAAMLFVDPRSWRIVEANEAAARFYGYATGELRGMPLRTLDRAGRLPCAGCEAPQQTPELREHLLADGSSRFVEVRASTSKGLLMAIVQDVTDRVEAQRALQLSREQLERMNRDLEDFARVASHDLQEPLRKVKTFGRLLASRHADQLDARGADYLERMIRATERMQAMISDILELSRMAHLEPVEALPEVALDEVVEDALHTLELRVEEQGAEVQIHAPLPCVRASASQLQQLFLNLLGNALKFRAPGRAPRIQLTAERVPRGAADSPDPLRAFVRVRLSDNGIGFEPRQAERIFSPFRRLHNARAYEGTGVGLAICRQIVERHQGTIEAEAIPGQGATFIITLPVEPVAPVAAAAAHAQGVALAL